MAFKPADQQISLLPSLIDYHAEHNGTHPFQLNYVNGQWHTTTHAEFASLVAGAATALFASEYKMPLRRAGDEGEHPFVTVLASSDVTSLALYVGLMKRGCATFPVSPRAPADAIVAMLSKLNCKHLLYTPQHANLALSVQAMLQEQDDVSHRLITFALAPTAEAIAAGAAACEGHFPYDFKLADEVDQPCLVFTTSGSTGLPKLCPYSHKQLLSSCAALDPGRFLDATQRLKSERILVPPPLFHFMGWSMGVLACLFGPLSKVTPPPGPPPTAATLIEMVRTHKCQQALFVPSQLDELSLDPSALATLAGMRRIFYGGAPISHQTLERLQSAGVTLCTIYGSTDIGAMGMTAHDAPSCEAGLWLKLREDFDYDFEPVSVDAQGTQLYELIVKSTQQIRTILEHQPGINRSGDLVALHPKRNVVSIVGRKSDLVILSNGENVATLPFEQAARSHPWISHAMVFGHGRAQAGILLQLRAAYADKPSDVVRKALLPVLDAVNAKSPDFAKIFPNMIVVASGNKPLFVSDKNSIQTARTLALYVDEIDAVYNEENFKHTVAPLASLQSEELRRFLADIVQRVLDAKLGPTTPLRDAGLDSLRATMIRRSVVAGLKEAQTAGMHGLNLNHLSTSFAFDGADLMELTNILDAFVNQGAAATLDQEVQQAKDLLNKYTLKPIISSSWRATNRVSGLNVLVTGTTGGLGCALLELLEREPSIARIICHNRPNALLAGKERQADAFERRGLSSLIAHSPKLEFIDGSIEELKRQQLPENLDVVLHAAWPVRFDLPLSSFESSIAGAHNLLELSRELGAKFVFISSVGVALGAATYRCKDREETYKLVETEQVELSWAMNAYGLSKSVVERLVSAAVHSTPGFEAFSIRSGQLVGDERTGSWNAHEWWPRIVRSASALGMLPEGVKMGPSDWLTINDAAHAVIDMTLAPRDTLQAATNASAHNVVNLVNPKRFTSAAQLFQPLVASPSVKIVSLSEWLSVLRRLHDSQEAQEDYAALASKVPALSLLTTYEDMYNARASTELEAGEAAFYLSNAKVLDEELALKFCAYWGVGKDVL